MKGIESMPIKILLTLVIVAAVVGVGVWQLNYFLGFNEKVKFKQDIAGLYQTIKNTQSFGDKGSFTTVWINVPADSYFNISIDKNEIVGSFDGEIQNFPLTADVLGIERDKDAGESLMKCDVADTCAEYNTKDNGPVKYGPGQYTLRLYYGEIPPTIQSWTIYFK